MEIIKEDILLNYEEILKAFQEKEFHIDDYISVVVESKDIREKLIQNLIEQTHINVYYRSYYLINAVSLTNPELFYEYWDLFVSLRYHKNSYHRNIFHWIITNLIPVDSQNKFDKIKKEYFSQIKDVKVLTGLEAMKDIIIMSQYRPDLEEEIISLFIDENMIKDYTDKQKDRFHFYSMEYFESLLDRKKDERLLDFIKTCLNAKNTTTAKKAKQILKKYTY